jgi:hypothetical protein
MAYTNQVLINRSKSVFIKEETTAGTLAYPTASDYVILASEPSLEQQQSTTAVSAMRSSRTANSTISNGFNYGSFSGLTISARPSGTKGTAPTAGEKALLRAALGKVTDSSTTGVNAVSISAITKADPGVITVPSTHGFKKGDKIKVGSCSQTEFNGSHVVASVTSTTITTETDTSSYAAAATDGDVTLDMVRFELAEELPTFSIWVVTDTGSSTTGGAVIEAAAGCQINSLSTSISKDGELQYTFAGDFSRLYYGGTATLSATAANAATTLTFDSGAYDVDNLFFVGQKVNIIDPAGTVTLDSAVSITAVNSTGNTLTVDALSVTSGPLPVGSIVSPYVPAGTISGSVLAQRKANVYLGSADTDYGHSGSDLIISGNKVTATGASVSLSQNLQKPLEKELTGDDYPGVGFIPENREVSGDVSLAFRMNDQNYYQDLKTTPRRSLAVTIGDTDGSIIEFYLPKVFMPVPTNSEDSGARVLNMSFTAEEPSAGTEEEFKLIYR